jgi:ABC-type sugar transport system permease subunit
MQPQVLSQPQRVSDGGAVARVVGVILLLPAAVLTIITLVVPTVNTVGTSRRAESFLDRGEAEDVGFDNFSAVLGDGRFSSALWFSVSLVLLPILVAVVVAPLVAAAFEWAGGWARVTARVVLSLAIVVFSPVALAIAWMRALREEPELLANPDLAGATVRTSLAFMTFGVVCAIGVMVFLPAFRARRKLWPTLFTIAGLVVLAMLAVGLQQFTVPFAMTGFGPRNETLTPVGMLFTTAFVNGQLGEGAAVSALLLLLLAVLGVVAVLVVVLTRLRVSVRPWGSPRSPGSSGSPVNAGAIVVALLALIAVVVVAVLTMGPWFDALGGAEPEGPPGAGGRTWPPALLSALLSVGVAYLGALGVSGLRPLGRHSEWLLMPFAPWLFVGAAPLGIEFFTSLRDEGELGEGDVFPPIMVSLVALVVLAVLCRGQAERRQQQMAAGASAGGSFFRTVVLPTLPAAVLLVVVTVFVNAQDLFWGLLTAQSPEDATTPMVLFTANSSLTAQDISVASATPLVAVVLGFVAVAAIQALHLDRMTATVGRPDDPTGPIRLPYGMPGPGWAGAPGQPGPAMAGQYSPMGQAPSGQVPQFGQAGQASGGQAPPVGQAGQPGQASTGQVPPAVQVSAGQVSPAGQASAGEPSPGQGSASEEAGSASPSSEEDGRSS